MKVVGNVHFEQKKALELVIECLPTPPDRPKVGRIYFNTVDYKLYIWNGENWLEIATAAAPSATYMVKVDARDPSAGFLYSKVDPSNFEVDSSNPHNHRLMLRDESVVTGKIANSSVTTDKLADRAVTAEKIATENIKEEHIADGQVTTSKIADGAVVGEKTTLYLNDLQDVEVVAPAADQVLVFDGTAWKPRTIGWDGDSYKVLLDSSDAIPDYLTAKIDHITLGINTISRTIEVAPGGIDTERLADGSVTSEKIANAAITSEKIADAAITRTKIANSAVSLEKIMDGAVDTTKLHTNAVTAEKIANGAVTTDKIANEAITADKIVPNIDLSIKGIFANIKDEDGTSPVNQITAGDGIVFSRPRTGVVEISCPYTSDEKVKISAEDPLEGYLVDKFDTTVFTIDSTDPEHPKLTIKESGIRGNHIAGNSIESRHISAQAITTTKLAVSAVTADRIADGAVTTDKIETGAVTADKIDFGLSALNDVDTGGVTDGNILIYNSASGWRPGYTSFTNLLDTPPTYTGHGDEAVFVKNTEDGLEFRTIITTDELVAAQSGDTPGYLVDKVDGITIEVNASNKLQVKDLSITTGKIADSAINNDKIQDGTIRVAKFADSTDNADTKHIHRLLHDETGAEVVRVDSGKVGLNTGINPAETSLDVVGNFRATLTDLQQCDYPGELYYAQSLSTYHMNIENHGWLPLPSRYSVLYFYRPSLKLWLLCDSIHTGYIKNLAATAEDVTIGPNCSYQADGPGWVLYTDGTVNSRCQLPDGSIVNNLGYFTVACWLNLEVLPTVETPILAFGTGGGEFVFGIKPTGAVYVKSPSASPNSAESVFHIEDHKWYFVAFNRDTSGSIFFIATPTEIAAVDGTTFDNNITIAGTERYLFGNTTDILNGKIYAVWLFDSGLGQQGLRALWRLFKFYFM